MTETACPPRWAEALLQFFLKSADFESVSGDLLEQYRDSISPARGRVRADWWYTNQVLAFVSPGARLFAVLFSAQDLARSALDRFAPTVEFHTRSTVSTAFGVGTLLAAGFWSAWRSGSVSTGAVTGVLAAGLASVVTIAGEAAMLAIWHSPQIMAAIRGSGGLEEAFTLPIMMVFPGLLLGVIGGAACAALKRVLLISGQR